MNNRTSAMRRKVLRYTLSLCASFVFAQSWVQAQESSQPLQIIVPFAPGGSNDIVGRAVANLLTARLHRSVIIENKPGAGGTIGSEKAARATPDGNTLLLISSTFTMNPSVMKLNYDPVQSFIPVAMLGQGPSVIAVNSSLPVNSIKELISYTKENPGKVNFGSSGVASFQHFAIELFKLKTGADLTIVQYRGGAPALVDLASGNVQVALGSLIQMQPYINSGKVKILSIAGPERVALIPDIPTLKEEGIDVDASNWWGIMAPKGTPGKVVESLHKNINAVLSDSKLKDSLASEGAQIQGASREDFTKKIAAETDRWETVAKQTGLSR
ncbi:Bug family tripartite tricarboxylate transporter substrate binding protein [Advenella kashmirensis]